MIPALFALAGIRRHAPQLLPGRKLGWLKGIDSLSFIAITLLFYWSEWPKTGRVLLVVDVGDGVYELAIWEYS